MFANKMRIEPPPPKGDLEEIRQWLTRFHSRIMKPPNYVEITADTDALDVGGYDSIYANTVDNNITIGGLSGGVNNQTVTILKTDYANSLTLEHNEGTGTEKIYTDGAADIVLPANTLGSFLLRCIYVGSDPYWWVVSSHTRS